MAFEKSVQLVLPDGSIASGAKAALKAVSFDPNSRWLYLLYEKFPGFAALSEWFYSLVARNRAAFSRLDRALLGINPNEAQTFYASRWIFLRILGIIFLIAFVSLDGQILGLAGAKGILPMSGMLEWGRATFGARAPWLMPTVFWMNAGDAALQGVCRAGAVASIFVIVGAFVPIALAAAWALYLSLVVGAGLFLSYQWDVLLLETALLAVFFAPFQWRPRLSAERPPSRLFQFLFTWLLFRLMFSSGYAKLASGDSMWRSLTALTVHYETQPLPTLLGWVAHQLPAAFQRFSCGVMFAIELGAPFLLFLPRRLKHAGALLIIGLQVLIALTGNYCFFNLITIALCLLQFDDAFWRKRIPLAAWRNAIDALWAKRAAPRRAALLLIPIAVLFAFLSAAQFSRTLWPKARVGTPIAAVTGVFAPFLSFNTYGLFAVMTTVRNEIVVQGSSDGTEWKTYVFKYKPQDLRRTPRWAAPHQPRLDWQMWFAALDARRERWFMEFLARLLQNSPNVTRLLESNPFPDAPPKYVRALFFKYRFTSMKEFRAGGAWWKAEKIGEYCPAVSLKQAA